MNVHCLQRRQFLPVALETAWAYFSNPRNLNEITPPDLRFRILNDPGDVMYAGQIILYRISLFPGLWTDWVTEIKHVQPLRAFVDEQRRGPYAFWHHRHAFEEGEGGTWMNDTVHYAVGFWLAGEVARRLYVSRRLESIFDYRAHVLKAKFNRIQTESLT